MCDSLKEKSGDGAVQRASPPPFSSIYHDEPPFGSPVLKPAPTPTRIRFLPRELPDGVMTASAMSSATMETHILDVESPQATLERKKQGGGIVYFPPENLAEYLDSSLVTPVTGGVSPAPSGSTRSGRGGRKAFSFFDEQCSASDGNDPVNTDVPGAKTGVRASTPTTTPRSEAVGFYCAFCMRTQPGTDRRRFEGNGGCSHEFCKKCLENYLYHRIMVGHHSLHPCPKFGEEACRASATQEDVRRMARTSVFREHCLRLEGRRGACEECGHRGRRSSSQPSPSPSPPPPPPPPSPPTPLSPSRPSSRDFAATAAAADEDKTCLSCGSTLKRQLHLHLHHHHHHNHNHRHNDHRQNQSTIGEAGKSKRRWSPRRASPLGANNSANGDAKTQRQQRTKRGQLNLAVADPAKSEANGTEAERDNAGQGSPRWFSPREWWAKARSARWSSSPR